MSLFKHIDAYIENEANLLGAVVSKDRPGYPEEMRNFEERRLDWTTGNIKKAILIQPKFTLNNVDSTQWSFRVVAWLDRTNSYTKTFVENSTFETIEESIESLFRMAVKELETISEKDLIKELPERRKPWWKFW